MIRDITLGQYYHADSVIHRMDRAGTNIQHDMISTLLILMYHINFSFAKKECRRDRRH